MTYPGWFLRIGLASTCGLWDACEVWSLLVAFLAARLLEIQVPSRSDTPCAFGFAIGLM